MKTPIPLAALAVLIIGAGCQSTQPHASNNPHKPDHAPNYTVTIESIPVNRLSATSREGGKPDAVYSSNIIAVYMNEVGKTNGGVTNAASINLPEKQK